jgi:hypothetical protein
MSKTKNKAYPRFKHDRIVNHPILGKVKVYNFKNHPNHDDDGAQSSFFRNNAQVNKSKQFGIKMFNTSIEAFAAYQRQALAAQEGLAPPVGKMVRWVIKGNKIRRTVNRWGYETAIADCSTPARIQATVLGCPRLEHEYREYLSVYDRKDSVLEMEHFLEYKEGECSGDGTYFSSFSAQSVSNAAGSLRMRLMNISLIGTQYDNIASIIDDGGSWDENNRLRLGQTVVEKDDYLMCTDLHRGNLGLWKGDPVVIDFGYHIAIPEYRDYDNLVTDYNFAGA